MVLELDDIQQNYLDFLLDDNNSFNGWLLTLSEDEFNRLAPILIDDSEFATEEVMDIQATYVYLMLFKTVTPTNEQLTQITDETNKQWEQTFIRIVTSVNLICTVREGLSTATNRQGHDDDWLFKLTEKGRKQAKMILTDIVKQIRR